MRAISRWLVLDRRIAAETCEVTTPAAVTARDAPYGVHTVLGVSADAAVAAQAQAAPLQTRATAEAAVAAAATIAPRVVLAAQPGAC